VQIVGSEELWRFDSSAGVVNNTHTTQPVWMVTALRGPSRAAAVPAGGSAIGGLAVMPSGRLRADVFAAGGGGVGFPTGGPVARRPMSDQGVCCVCALNERRLCR
jgi:hypothetical protein